MSDKDDGSQQDHPSWIGICEKPDHNEFCQDQSSCAKDPLAPKTTMPSDRKSLKIMTASPETERRVARQLAPEDAVHPGAANHNAGSVLAPTGSPETSGDRAFMEQALALAREAGELGEIPVGALAVRDGLVIGRGYNRREIDRDPLAHAELIALKQAASQLGAWRLANVVLYVTLEPCAMCAGAMVQGRIARLVYGADDPKTGAAGSLYNLVEEARHNHRPAVTRGVLADESSKLLVDFFRGLRVKGG